MKGLKSTIKYTEKFNRKYPESLDIAAARYEQSSFYYHEKEALTNVLGRLPHYLKSMVKRRCSYDVKTAGFSAAYQQIKKVDDALDKLGIKLSYNDTKLSEMAIARADSCLKLLKTGGVCYLIRYVRGLGVDIPAGLTEESRAARLCDSHWWERRLRTLQIRASETIAREFGVVNKKNNVYISNAAVSRIETRRHNSWQVLKQLECVNQDNEEERLNMYDVAQKSIANPANRHNELMVRAAGFDAYSRRFAHVADFFTITCPSKYHAYHYSGHPNEKFAGFSPRDAQNYLVTLWARIRAKLKREKIQIYGLRIAEPHHDGTPHWHMLLYVTKKNRQALRRIIRTYAMTEDNDELYSEKRKAARYTVEGINPSRGSGASYILKYIAKNIEGIKSDDSKDYETTDTDAEKGNRVGGVDSAVTALRVSVWASVWGIRQFQQIGGGSITIWRELRRIRELEESSVQGDLFRLWQAADSNGWDTFLLLLGGADMPKSQQLAGLYKEIAPEEVRIDESSGEWFDLSLNKYGEPRELVLGVQSKGFVLRTAIKRWRIEKVPRGGDSPPLEFCK